MTEPTVVRPNPRVFVIRSTFRTALFSFPLVLLFTALAPAVDMASGTAFVLLVGVWLGLVVFRFVQRRVVFGKTRYLVHPDRIVLETGGLLSERSVDLQFGNVTQLTLTLPFVEHKLYSTGHVAVQAAGSAAAEVLLESVDRPHEVFALLTDALRSNGFSLAQERVVQQEKPGLVGAVYVLGASTISVGFAILVGVPGMLDIFIEIMSEEAFSQGVDYLVSGSEIDTTVDVGAILALLSLGLIMSFVSLLFIGLRTMDILRRTYTLYDDTIDYKDGFLTKKHSFIPMENLADVEVNETIVQRILQISTLKISCQGAGSDIHLSALPNGPAFKANLEQLIDDAERREPSVQQDEPGAVAPEARRERSLPDTSALPGVEGHYDWKRGVAGPLFGLAIALIMTVPITLVLWAAVPEFEAEMGVGLAFVILISVVSTVGPMLFQVGLKAYGMKYEVDARKVSFRFEVLSRKQQEFTVDKISAVEIRRTPVDRLFKTARVSFTSIGTLQKITFEHLKNADEIVTAVLRRMGLDPSSIVRTVKPRYSVGAMVRSLDSVAVFGLVFLLGAIPLALLPTLVPAVAAAVAGLGLVVGRLVYLPIYYGQAKLDIGTTWLRVKTGLWARNTFYAPTAEVRGISSRCYLGDEQGVIGFHCGGGARSSLAFVSDVRRLQDEIDSRLHRDDTGTDLDMALIEERKPSVVATLAQLLALVVFVFPMIPWLIVATRRIRFVLQRERIAKESGVFFRRRYTILLERIDHLTTSRGLVNRLTNTGSVGIRTLGSTGTDMSVSHVSDHQQLYERIEGLTAKRVGD